MTVRGWARLSGVLVAVALLAGCERDAAKPAPAPPAPKPAAPAPPAAPPAALTRAQILEALEQAASAHAAGAKPDAALAGRTFVIRLPFGCFGPEPAGGAKDGLAHWAWSKDRSSIRLSASPADWSRSPLVLPSGVEPPWDGVEGFWIARPWLRSDACPPRPTPPSPRTPTPTPASPPAPDAPAPPPVVAASPMTMGLAAILSPEGSRLGRRDGDAYSFVIRGEGETPPPLPLGGYRLVLEGRIGAFPDGSPVRCTSSNPDRRPVCLAAVQLDVIAFEDAAGARLSEWRPT